MHSKTIIWCLVIICLFFDLQILKANEGIRNIFIEKKNVFEPEDADWFFASKFLNSLHTLTKDYVIEAELLFDTNTVISEDLFLETERNLRNLGLFSDIKIELEDVEPGFVDVYVTTKDRWSLYPSIILGANGGEYQFGAGIKEHNVAGNGILFSVGATYVVKKDTTGYTGWLELEKKRVFGSRWDVVFAGYKTFLYDSVTFSINKPFRTIKTETSYGISGLNTNGNAYFVNRNSNIFNGVRRDTAKPETVAYIDTLQYIRYKEQNIKLWYSTQWLSADRVYFSTLLELQKSNRSLDVFDRAYDNQGKLLIGFSSISQTFHTIKNANTYYDEDLAIGGWGNVILGAIFPVNQYGEKGLFYVGAQAEKSYYYKNVYLFGQLAASSSFSSDFAKYTYQKFLGLFFFRLSDKFTFACRVLEQAVWNYPRMRQLMLDDFHGVRGYNLQKLAGDNRLISNIELRYFSDLSISVMRFSGVIFYDIGAIWNQRVANALAKSRFFSSIGLGLRGHFTKSNNPDHTVRVDIPYNFATKSFGISVGVQQYFSVINSHEFKLPEVYSSEFNAK